MENDTKEVRKLRTDVRGRTIQALDSTYESIREGDEFTTFTEFCRRLGVEPKTGNSKRAQVEQFTLNRIPYVIILGILCGFLSLYVTRVMIWNENIYRTERQS